MKKFIFILILFLGFNVFAEDIDVTSNCYGTTGYPSMYTGNEVQYQTLNNYSFGTTYQFKLSSFETELRYNLLADTDYILTLNTNNSDDFRNNFRTYNVYDLNNNNNNLVTGFTFVSMKKVQILFKTTTATDRVKIQIGGSNVYDNITGDVNWNIKNAILTIPDSNSNDNTNNIINNNNQNTSDIINNNNNNTQDIINNQNQNNENILNGIDGVNQQLGVCYKNLLSFNDLYPAYNTYIEGKTFKQTEADVPSDPGSGRGIKLQLYDSSNNLIDNIVNSEFLSVARFNFFFTNSSDIYKVEFGVNGSVRDTKVGFYTADLNLETNSSYTLSFSILNATQGNITLSNFSLVKGNYNSNVIIDYGKSICTSKIDETNNAINNSTNSIINNQNQNSQATQDTINNNLNTCVNSRRFNTSDITLDNYRIFDSNGNKTPNTSWGIIEYVPILPNTDYTLSSLYGSSYYCLYNSSKTVISCSSYGSLPSVSFNSNSATFISLSLYKGRSILVNGQYCTSKLDDTKNAINDVNNSLTNPNIDSGTGQGFFDNFTDQDFGLSQIVTIPLNTIQGLTSSSCVPLQVPIPFTNSSISLPCMTSLYETKFPTIYNLWKIVSFGIVAYLIAIDIFHIVKGFKDPESDKVEVLDL